jgi:hypothetical protein
MESLCKKYNITLNDVEALRHFPDVQSRVDQIMKAEGLEFNMEQSNENKTRILEIWFEVISNFKKDL